MTKRIMVVDDNAAVRRALRTLLENQKDWKVYGEAINGRDAVEQAQRLHPDLIVLDLSMPVMNGLQAGRLLHSLMPNVPVILCSLHIDDILQNQAAALGIQAVVSKAQNMQVLVKKAEELLRAA
jgi:DNA-binding NarL/FixJ family response regulator